MKPLFIQGIFYLLATPILFILAWRFYNYHKATGSKFAKLFIYIAVLGGIDLFGLAIFDFFFPYNLVALTIRQIGTALFHMLIFLFLFKAVLYSKFTESPQKQKIGLLVYLIPILIYSVWVIISSESPTVTPQGFIRWNYPTGSNYLKIFIAAGTLISLALVFFQRVKTRRVRAFFLGAACLAGLGYYFFVYLIKEEIGSISEIFIIGLMVFATLLVLLSRGKTIVRETIYLIEGKEEKTQ